MPYYVGDVVVLTRTFTANDAPANPTTVRVLVKRPDGTIVEHAGPQVANPEVGVFRLDLPVDQSGTWHYRWEATGAVVDTDEGAFFVLASYFGGPEQPSAIAPTPEEVHALIPQRAAGVEFSANTVPTLAQVQGVVAGVATDVQTFVNAVIPANLMGLAHLAVTYGAAATIERALFPGDSEDSDYENLQSKYVELRDRLAALVKEHHEGGSSELPRGFFPRPLPSGVEEVFQPISKMGF